MKRRKKTISVIALTLVLIAAGIGWSIASPSPVLPEYSVLADGTKVIENQTFSQQVNLIGERYSNLVMRNCTIENLPPNHTGIFLRDVSNVRIENCTVRNLTGYRNGHGGGIRLSSTKDNRNITIQNCHIENVESNGISVAQRSGDSPVHNAGIKILNNTIVNVAKGRYPLMPGRFHGIYCQGRDFLIEGNVIHDVADGNGISVRSSGIVRGNKVYSVGAGDPIRYYNDHDWGDSGELLIENNICYDETYERGQRAMISLVYDEAHPEYRGDKFTIRFNTCVGLTNNVASIFVAKEFAGADVTLSGNLLISPSQCYVDGPAVSMTHNFESSELAGFKSSSAEYDFHLTANHGAIGFASSLNTFPDTDIDGDRRTVDTLDAGADQYLSADTIKARAN